MKRELRHLWFNVHKSMFDKLTVKELRNEMSGKGIIKNVHKMNKKELIGNILENGIEGICLMDRHLTPKRICELRKLVGNNSNQMNIFEDGDLEFFIGNDLKFEKYSQLFLHKDCEIFDELGYDMKEFNKMSNKGQYDIYSKIENVVNEKWSQYCSGSIDSMILFDETNYVETKEGPIRFDEFEVQMI